MKAGGDIDNDGIDDLIIGASRADPGNRDSAGETYVVYGRAPITDSDSDGLSDDNDNCLLVANSDQRDTDGDGHGNVCDADLNQDCGVNMLDFNLLVDQFFTTSADPDFNGDGYINFLDFSLFKSMFIQPVGPSASPSLCD